MHDLKEDENENLFKDLYVAVSMSVANSKNILKVLKFTFGGFTSFNVDNSTPITYQMKNN